jgi:hypothetical protein
MPAVFLALNRFGWPTGQRSHSGGFENGPDFICGYSHAVHRSKSSCHTNCFGRYVGVFV